MPSLSQKYRPKTFAEITGQGHVTETLRKEVATGKLAHAFLFSGPRGVGKTTTARVFAKALNCEKPSDGEPCNACAPCRAANEGKLMDLIELDAATHTGVDTVREAIIEHARFSPMIGRRKIYVLDEAHMLSASSWNALLKTLEEPPPYAFFILATTEWHKVPATIVSRCQRFEFRRIPDDVLAKRVDELAKAEGWKVDDEVGKLIVSRSDGCVRDAETLLGQIASLGEKKIGLEVAALVIPPSHVPLAAGLMRRWADRDHAGSLAEARRLFDEGVAILPFMDDLLLVVRRLLAASGDPALATRWEQGPEEERAVASLVGRFSPEELHDVALMLMERRRDVKQGVDPLFALELAGTMAACGMLKRASLPPPQRGGAGGGVGTSALTAPPPAPSQQEGEPLNLSTVRAQWHAIIRVIGEKNHSLPFILKISQPHAVDGNRLILRFQYPFHRDKVLQDAKNRRLVEDGARDVLGIRELTIDGVVGEDAPAAEERKQDIVSNILKAFGGSVVE